jgi:SNF2 family DNA or RNA helicase
MSPLATAPPDQPAQAGLLDRYAPLLRRLEDAKPLDESDLAFFTDAVAAWARPGFDTFASLPRLRFEPLPHQLRAAATALARMRGRAILADEVGLGKTIEALLVLSELRLRRLARRVLILVPAGLVGQWSEELERKFALEASLAGGAASDSGLEGVVLASIATARRAPLRDRLAARTWDLVIVDEAHRARNPHSASGRLVRSLKAKQILLLTATPVENRLEDLFELVSMVKPGHLGSLASFRARHRVSSRPDAIRDPRALQARMREVMIRHRRSQVEVMLPAREAETLLVAPAAGEAELYRSVSERVRSEARQRPGIRLQLQTVQRMAGSSGAALAVTLHRLGWDDLAARADALPMPSKVQALRAVVDRHLRAGEKLIVFTAFTETLHAIVGALREGGVEAAVYHGSLSRHQKDEVIRDFSRDVDVLLSTEAGGEGRNLQFCHAMVNFDLPWNPMQIEQRLGRIHRIGQSHDVTLHNLVSRGTIEERILHILEAKLNLFELVVGELDMVLGRVAEEGDDFAAQVFEAHVASADDAELQQRLESLGESLAAARREYIGSRARTDELVGEME